MNTGLNTLNSHIFYFTFFLTQHKICKRQNRKNNNFFIKNYLFEMWLQALNSRLDCAIQFAHAVLFFFFYFCKRFHDLTVTKKINASRMIANVEHKCATERGFNAVWYNIRTYLRIDRLDLQRRHVSFLPKRDPAAGNNLRKPSVTACCFRRKVLFDMYAIQRPATLKWLRAQQSCGSATFGVAL